MATTDPEQRRELPSVPLTQLSSGARARLASAADLPDEDRALLRALGLGRQRHFRVCKNGGPWILQVGGTRIGLADTLASRLLVVPVTDL